MRQSYHDHVLDPSMPLSNVALETRTNGGLLACFSRPVSARGTGGRALSLAGGTGFNFASSPMRAAHPGRHAMDEHHLCRSVVRGIACNMAGAGQQWKDAGSH